MHQLISRFVSLARSRATIMIATGCAVSIGGSAKAGDSCGWSQFGDGAFAQVLALAVYDDGTGPSLYAGGNFNYVDGGVSRHGIARWDGSQWARVGLGLGPGFGVTVNAMVVFNDGTGDALYAAGSFSSADGNPVSRIARWDGTAWSALGSGIASNVVNDLIVYNDGTGNALYAVGDFGVAGGTQASRVAKWNGTSWSALGSGVLSDTTQPHAYALGVYNDGSGSALFVGGNFNIAGGQTANRIAKWNGTAWSTVGFGTGNGIGNGIVYAMTTFNDGTGDALYVAGSFSLAGGVSAPSHIAKWNGTTWSPVGSIFFSGNPGRVHALAVYNDGTGDALYAAGSFTTSTGTPLANIARWDGTAWVWFDDSPVGIATSLLSHDGLLHVGGNFNSVGAETMRGVATWSLCQPCPADLNNDGELNFFDVQAFLQGFAAQDPIADFNDDGEYNFFDVQAFLQAFAAGCP